MTNSHPHSHSKLDIGDRVLVDAYQVIVNHLRRCAGEDPSVLANFDGTAERCAKALMHFSHTPDEMSKRIREIVQKSFPVSRGEVKEGTQSSAGMITQGPLQINSMCPHHLFPVIYECWVSYVPSFGGRVLGLSKFARLAQVLSTRPVLQEQLASDIADVLYEGTDNLPGIGSDGSAVSLIGLHTCMSCRGIEQRAVTTTTELRGCYWDTTLESKFQSAINLAQRARNTI